MVKYFSLVRGRQHYGDVNRGIAPKSIRQLNREWRMASVPVVKGKGRPSAGVFCICIFTN